MLRDNHAVVEDLNLYQELNDQAADQITGGKYYAAVRPLPGGGLDITPNPGETATCYNVPGIGVVCNVTR